MTMDLSAARGSGLLVVGRMAKMGVRCVQRTEVMRLTWLEKLGGRVWVVVWGEGERMVRM